MATVTKPGDRLLQNHAPGGRYALPGDLWGLEVDQAVSVQRVRPPGDGKDLELADAGVVDGVRQLTVWGGIPGARYRITIGAKTFDVSVTLHALPVQSPAADPVPNPARWRRDPA